MTSRSQQLYDYSYHSGANITISINDNSLLDCVGISYNVIDSKTPVYGYNSRLFDAVAPGQKIIQGSFVVNYMGPNYVYNVMEEGMRSTAASSLAAGGSQSRQPTNQSTFSQDGSYDNILAYMQQQRATYWHDSPAAATAAQEPPIKDVTLVPTSTIQIIFDGMTRSPGKNIGGIELYGVYIIGHGQTIQISENVLLEEYNFFARTLRELGGKDFNKNR